MNGINYIILYIIYISTIKSSMQQKRERERNYYEVTFMFVVYEMFFPFSTTTTITTSFCIINTKIYYIYLDSTNLHF